MDLSPGTAEETAKDAKYLASSWLENWKRKPNSTGRQLWIKEATNLDTELSTAGGTSDGRFIAPTGSQVVELGPCNATIHKVDECVRVDDLGKLTVMYTESLKHLLT